MGDREREQQLRREPISRSFLLLLFSSLVVQENMQKALNRVITKSAEGGFVVYKLVGTDTFTVIPKYGFPAISERADVSAMTGRVTAEIPLYDNSEELERHGISPTTHVRAGDFHTHPMTAFLSRSDLLNFENRVLGSKKDFILAARESFRMIGCIRRSTTGVEVVKLFGISIPSSGPTSNMYQYVVDTTHDQERQAQVLRDSGFRVVQCDVPNRGNGRLLDEETIISLSLLGSM